MKWRMRNVEFCLSQSIFQKKTDPRSKCLPKKNNNRERKKPFATPLNSSFWKTPKRNMSLTRRSFIHRMIRRMGPCLTMMMAKMKSMNTSYGRFGSWKGLEEIETREGKLKCRGLKLSGEERWITRKYCWRTRLWGQMRLKIPTRLSTFTCRSITIKGHSIKIHRIPYLREIITCRPPCKCKINRCYQKSYREGRGTSGKRANLNTST